MSFTTNSISSSTENGAEQNEQRQWSPRGEASCTPGFSVQSRHPPSRTRSKVVGLEYRLGGSTFEMARHGRSSINAKLDVCVLVDHPSALAVLERSYIDGDTRDTHAGLQLDRSISTIRLNDAFEGLKYTS